MAVEGLTSDSPLMCPHCLALVNHGSDRELISESNEARGMAYSLDPADYDPRCVSCHKAFDSNRGEPDAQRDP